MTDDTQQETEDDKMTTRSPNIFQVGQHCAQAIQRETGAGPSYRIELFWRDPEYSIMNPVATFDRHDVVDICAALQLALIGDVTVSSQKWLRANLLWTPPGSLARSLLRLLDYVWTDEERDYFGREEGLRAGHIFEEMLLLKRFAAED